MPHSIKIPFSVLLLAAFATVPLAAQEGLGYTDTPSIPGTPWRVPDGNRPQPRGVTPGASFSLPAPPPSVFAES